MNRFYMLSLSHSTGDLLSWWGPRECGYSRDLEGAGFYTNDDVDRMRRRPGYGKSFVAVPVAEAERLASRVVAAEWINIVQILKATIFGNAHPHGELFFYPSEGLVVRDPQDRKTVARWNDNGWESSSGVPFNSDNEDDEVEDEP